MAHPWQPTLIVKAVSEPSSAGIQYGDLFFYPIGKGLDFAESSYNSVYYGTRWMIVYYGDPLYAPFRGSKQMDNTPPEFGLVMTKRPANSTTSRRIIINLADGDDDKLVDVAQYKIEYGATVAYDNSVEFEIGWDSVNGSWKEETQRDYFLARQYERTIQGLNATQTYHYRISARDPSGNTAISPDLVFNMSLAADTAIPSATTYAEDPGNSPNITFSVFPLPANPSLNIQLSGNWQKQGKLNIEIFDLTGRSVRELYSGKAMERVHWDGTDNKGNSIASGVYFIRCQLGKQSTVLKALLIR
ncbi:MAG: hypothetical protein A2519_11345 [Candidatus Raymondbacteria bacterium RIFOXYD12_FULL_49_13]|uniref:Secretion system C-terminal sorting domain-containing protein n=1 Tax=Candidatus Raymondbacteria bacterium RIFOXYD12_FULL_49_13 TaxID=1817890 RepID=A0A1F7F7U3_UNCRA|nr:MAG: hypothetical protein A2519_11345 [Candidatus Raymondbacteria bacterium RIFOXYD12_FULL_49_13]